MNRYLPVFPALGIVITIAHATPLLALERSEIAATTKEVTVRIEGEETSGTGTIIEQDGDTYTVLTCWHVVNAEGGFEVTTVDGETHKVTTLKNLGDIDLAIVQFTSNTFYEVAELGDSEAVIEGTTGYVVGYPDPIPGIPELAYDFQNTNITRKLETGENGYRLVHDKPTTGGSSGGGIFDNDGYLVGINGRTTEDAAGRVAYGLAIPINVFLTEEANLTIPSSFSPPTDLVSLGIRKLNRRDYQGAVDDFSQLLASNPNDFDALWGRANAYYELKDFNAAIDDLNVVLQLDPDNASAYGNRGNSYNNLEEDDKAIADYTEALRLDPDNAVAYNNRGISYHDLQEYNKAIADYTEALRLDPDYAYIYYNRGNSYGNLKEYNKAIADYTEALRLDPNLAIAYYIRGFSYQNLGNKTLAIQDFQQAANLFLQQGNTEFYQNALDRIEQLQ